MPFSTNLSGAIEVCVTLYMCLKQACDFLSVIKKKKEEINIFNSEMLVFPEWLVNADSKSDYRKHLFHKLYIYVLFSMNQFD